MKHKEKTYLAKKMMNKDEKKKRVSLFLCEGWVKMKSDIKKRVEKKVKAAKKRALLRRNK